MIKFPPLATQAENTTPTDAKVTTRFVRFAAGSQSVGWYVFLAFVALIFSLPPLLKGGGRLVTGKTSARLTVICYNDTPEDPKQ